MVFFTGGSRPRNPIKVIEQAPHALGIERLLRPRVELVRGAGQLEFDSRLPDLEIKAAQIAATLVANQGADGSPGNSDQFRLHDLSTLARCGRSR